MYLFSELQIIPLVFLFLLWGIGGWLMTIRWFDLESYERGFIGFGLGLVIANWLGNILVRVLPMPLAFWTAGLLTLVLGVIAAWPLNRKFFSGRVEFRLSNWVMFGLVVVVFTLIGRGLGMQDDHQNLPTISLMATGDIPPHVAGSPDVRYGYHYFLILLGVQFMRVADSAPWTALDLARGLTLALTIFIAGLLAFRLTRNKTVAWLSALFFAFASGTRWLLLLLPVSLLNKISSSLTLIGSGRDTASNLFRALSLPWEAAGSGPIPFPFAFVNGVNSTFIMTHNGYGVSADLIMLMLILLAGRHKTWLAGILFSILLASLALANEVDFAILYAGIALAVMIWGIQNKTVRPPRTIWFWATIAVSAGMIAALQGGMITETLRGILQPTSSQAESYFKASFSLVPPTLISSHLGKLSLLDPIQLLAALFEVGPTILVLPFVLIWGYKALQDEKWVPAAFAACTIPSLLSIFIEHSGNAGITATTRLLSNAFFMCKILAVPLLWLWLQRQPEWKHTVAHALGGITMLGGLALFSIELIAIPRPVHTYFITNMDARFYEQYWDRLTPPSAWVFDPDTTRALTIFGRQAHSTLNFGVNTPEYLALIENPDPYLLNAAGYSYVYADKDYWKAYAETLDQPCVKVLQTIEGEKFSHGVFVPDFRQLAEISECK